jgi:hypothetical protein
MARGISRAEYKILCLVAMALIIVAVAPYVVGYFKTPSGQVFLGTSPFNIADQPVYYTYIEQVKSGSFTNFDFFTPEKQGRGIFQVSWFVPGVLARVFDFSPIAAYHIWRIFLIPILIFILYLFISLFFAEKFLRFTAFLLALFGSGWGVYALAFLSDKFYSLPKFLPLDVWVPESNTFLSLMLTPHFVLSLIFLLLVFYFWILFIKTSKIIFSVISGFVAVIFFSFHPYFVPLVYLVLGLQAVLIIWQERKVFTPKILGLIIVFALSFPSVLYHFYLLASDYVLRMRGLEMLESNFMPTIFAMLVGYGIFGIIAVFGAAKNFKNISKQEWLFAYLWLFSNVILFFLPFAFPRRLTEGFQIPLALFSAVFIVFIFKKIAANYSRKRLVVLIVFAVLILMPTTVFNFSRFFTVYFFPGAEEPFFYRQRGEIEAMGWLRQNTPSGTVILAAPWNGNLIPAFSQRKVFFGHMDETLFAAFRKAEADWFFKDNSNDVLKKEFLKREGVGYVFWSEKEDFLGTFKPDEKDFLKLIYQNDKARIYKTVF